MKRTLTAITLALAVSALTSLAQDSDSMPPQPPADGGHPPHVLPPHAAEKLKLTDDQKKQIADLDDDVKARLEKILTPEQFKELQEMRPPRPPGGGPPPDQNSDNNAPQQ
jgi:Spy/CpxP family protein refolding chaperone